MDSATSLNAEHSPSSPFAQALTGDVFLMNRNCFAMKDPLAMGLCLLTKTENRFDHVGMLVKISQEDLQRFPEAKKRVVDNSPSDTYVLETNLKGITLFAAEKRVERSSAYEVAVRTVDIEGAAAPRNGGVTEEGKLLNQRMLGILEGMYDAPYQNDYRAILPSVFSPPDKMDRIDASNKINELRMEMDAIRETLSRRRPEDADSRYEVYKRLLSSYERATGELLDTYFPHLERTSATSAVWDRGHMIIDGSNHSPKMVCTELIGNLWLKAGITNGYLPASSLRPFDFLDDTRFNFTERGMRLGDLVPFKVGQGHQRYWSDAETEQTARPPLETSTPVVEDPHLKFYNERIRGDKLLKFPPAESLAEVVAGEGGERKLVPDRWVVQSNDQSTVRDLAVRLFGVGALFAVWGLPCAPLTLQWVEGQTGLFLIRGSVWSLGCGFLARNLCFVTVQGLTAYALGSLLAARTKGHSGGTVHDVMRRDIERPNSTQSDHGGETGGRAPTSAAAGAPPPPLVDWRHPYYTIVGVFALSSAAAHVATQPIVNSVIAHHFGPLRAGPLPRSLLMKGAYCLAPFSMLLPMQGYFLSWYETGGSFVVPVRSSVFRPRQEHLECPDWPHFRNDALVGAFAAMTVFDLLLYPFHTGVMRSLIRGLYRPRPSPSIGRGLYPSYRYRFASNLFVSTATCATLSFVFNLL